MIHAVEDARRDRDSLAYFGDRRAEAQRGGVDRNWCVAAIARCEADRDLIGVADRADRDRHADHFARDVAATKVRSKTRAHGILAADQRGLR